MLKILRHRPLHRRAAGTEEPGGAGTRPQAATGGAHREPIAEAEWCRSTW